MIGTGTALRLVICETYHHQVSIYTGTCDQLQCAGEENDRIAETSDCSSTGKVLQWSSEFGGVMYHILVRGYDSMSPDFDLSIIEIDAPPNDHCENAIEMSLGKSYGASLENSTIDIIPHGDLCQQTSYSTTGVWYTVLGTGTALKLEANSIVNVFSSATNSCDMLECVGDYWPSSDDSSPFIWQSTEGTMYYFRVRHWDFGDNGLLNVTDVDTPSNDRCEEAIGPLPPNGTVITGSVENASMLRRDRLDDGDDNCVFFVHEGNVGVWYLVIGTGKWIHVSYCNKDTTFVPSTTIFTGSCDNLGCTDSKDHDVMFSWDGETGLCRVTPMGDEVLLAPFCWKSNAGQTYYLFVGADMYEYHAHLDDLGWTFGLSLESNDEVCSSPRFGRVRFFLPLCMVMAVAAFVAV